MDREILVRLRARKVFRQNESLVVTLPIEYTKTFGIKEGTVMEPIMRSDGALILIPKKERGDCCDGPKRNREVNV